jgi:hypothetical protein
MSQNNHRSPQYLLHQLHSRNYVPIPLVSSLNDSGQQVISTICGFPENWCDGQISTWLGNHDYIPFSRTEIANQDSTDSDDVNYKLTTNYNPVSHVWDRDDIIWINLPLHCFDLGIMRQIGMQLLSPSFDFGDESDWLEYLSHGGSDRLAIGIKRYNENTNIAIRPQINENNENLEDSLGPGWGRTSN